MQGAVQDHAIASHDFDAILSREVQPGIQKVPKTFRNRRSTKKAASRKAAFLQDLYGLKTSGRFLAVLAYFDLVGNLLPFIKGGDVPALKGGNMDENVVSTLTRCDKTKTLGRVEPFYGACCHNKAPFST
ncbi:hypothetical protein A0U93_13535 [Neoasaia chiangmaiensis]|uniref:Uncharacterized protein n=1 Tax=Neoasaia chiangmaiensis TaxID=320497 RepID=A0A1U9KSL3_9PROT|nr:hypothetical protein A0U93_13535 [Neoasaia chiangmaiensis]